MFLIAFFASSLTPSPVFAAQCVIATLDLVHDFQRQRNRPKGGLTAEHEDKTHTRRPHITRLVISSLQNLRRTIRHGARLRPDDFPFLEVARQTEVSNLQRSLFQRFILCEFRLSLLICLTLCLRVCLCLCLFFSAL